MQFDSETEEEQSVESEDHLANAEEIFIILWIKDDRQEDSDLYDPDWLLTQDLYGYILWYVCEIEKVEWCTQTLDCSNSKVLYDTLISLISLNYNPLRITQALEKKIKQLEPISLDGIIDDRKQTVLHIMLMDAQHPENMCTTCFDIILDAAKNLKNVSPLLLAQDHLQYPPLHMSCFRGEVAYTNKLLAVAHEINDDDQTLATILTLQDNSNSTALDWACINGKIACTKKILEAAHNIKDCCKILKKMLLIPTSGNHNVFYRSLNAHHTACVDLLILACHEIHNDENKTLHELILAPGENNRTVLHLGSRPDDNNNVLLDVIRAFFSTMCSLNGIHEVLHDLLLAQDGGGNTALHYCSYHNQLEYARILLDVAQHSNLEYGTVNLLLIQTNNQGLTSLDIARNQSLIRLETLLCKYGSLH